MSQPIRVVVVEDSRTRIAHLIRALEAQSDIRAVAQAASRAEALEAVLRQRPDVVTMDLVLADRGFGHDAAGIDAIRDIMAVAPTPILVVSSRIDGAGSRLAVEALAAGAADAFPLPASWTDSTGEELRERVRVVSGVRVMRRRAVPQPPRAVPGPPPAVPGGGCVIGIGASTGGPAALRAVLSELHGIEAPMLVVQHLHPDFAGTFAEWLAETTGVPVELARRGSFPEPGRVYVGPPGRHLRLLPSGRLGLSSEPAGLHRPSVDQLFTSVAEHAGPRAVAALLTGMGEDGARGLLDVRRQGGVTIAQDEASAAVFGMPAAAVRSGAAGSVLPLTEIGRAIRGAATAARR